jgi:diguanylate cyclase (GGDEF)-like protein/excisionase family DNA binding protein
MSARLAHPVDATLSVTKAARLLGVHPNTIRAWSDAGRLRYFRINRRGDRRFRLGDLQRFLAASGSSPVRSPGRTPRGAIPQGRAKASADSAGSGPAAIQRLPRRSGPAQKTAWTAQLTSIQQLGARLNRLTSVEEIARTIVAELRSLIDHDNIRVYRQSSQELVPIALVGSVGEYADETVDDLRLAVGQGITGWVAVHKVGQILPDAAKDPRATTIPGTTDDLDESMLLAPMVFDDAVLGVLVLTKLGLDQYSDDDLRLLEIYASFAAQALSNAEITGQLRAKSAALERILRTNRDLLTITESVLTTLDPRAVLEQVADRLNELVGYENLSIEVVDQATGELRSITNRGPHPRWTLVANGDGAMELARWVIRERDGLLIPDERRDSRLQTSHSQAKEGSLIAVPLRGRAGPIGALIVERLGTEDRFTEVEFELVRLFAGQVSIALRNAEAHREVQIQAATDVLTGLLNHRTFQDRLEAQVAAGEPFGLIMLDLDVFKNVNDAFGHQAGDRLLADIARAIAGASRDVDLVFRYGGDEFTVILPGADGHGSMLVARRLLAAIAALGEAGGLWSRHGLSISASLGVASFPTDGGRADDVLLAADRACQVAKRTGRARICTAAQGLRLAAEFELKRPTPVDSPGS